jgi:hypothetical protein
MQNVAAAYIMPPTQSNAPPSSTLPININAKLDEFPNAVLIACGEVGFRINLGSADNQSNTAIHVHSHQLAGIVHAGMQLGGQVDQNSNFSGPIQYFFNIEWINCDPNMSINDFLGSLE